MLVNLRVFANATFNLTRVLSTLDNIAMVGVELVMMITFAAMIIMTISTERGNFSEDTLAQTLDQSYQWAFIFLTVIVLIGQKAFVCLKSCKSEIMKERPD